MTTDKHRLKIAAPALIEFLEYLVCVLLITGNFLPWNCWEGLNPLSGCYEGIVYNPYSLSVRWLVLPVLSAIGTLILAFMVNRVKPWLNYVLWLLVAANSAFLVAPGFADRPTVVVRLGWAWQPAIDLLRLILPPASLAAVWLICRPLSLRSRWKPAVLACLGTLAVGSAAYLIYLGYWVGQSLVEGGTKSLGLGVPLILVSGVLLLGAEIWEGRRSRSQADPPKG